MQTQEITSLTVERNGREILCAAMPVPASFQDVRKAFLSLHLPRAFSIRVDPAGSALVTIL